MNQHLTDEERGERLRQWWQTNGRALLAGLLLTLFIVFAWRLYEGRRLQHALDASAQYQAMLTAMAEARPEAAADLGYGLRENAPASPYADLAGLHLARLALERDDPGAAMAVLRQVIATTERPALQGLAQIRLARLLAATGQAQQALDLLAGIESDSPSDSPYAALADELRGDAYRDLHAHAKARAAYRRAIAARGGQAGEYLQMKHDDLGPDPTQHPAP